MAKKIQKTTTATKVLIKESAETKHLTAEEERILRMRSGASVEPDAALESKLDDVAEEHRDEASARLALIQDMIMAQLETRAGGRQERKLRIVDALKDD